MKLPFLVITSMLISSSLFAAAECDLELAKVIDQSYQIGIQEGRMRSLKSMQLTLKDVSKGQSKFEESRRDLDSRIASVGALIDAKTKALADSSDLLRKKCF